MVQYGFGPYPVPYPYRIPYTGVIEEHDVLGQNRYWCKFGLPVWYPYKYGLKIWFSDCRWYGYRPVYMVPVSTICMGIVGIPTQSSYLLTIIIETKEVPDSPLRQPVHSMAYQRKEPPLDGSEMWEQLPPSLESCYVRYPSFFHWVWNTGLQHDPGDFLTFENFKLLEFKCLFWTRIVIDLICQDRHRPPSQKLFSRMFSERDRNDQSLPRWMSRDVEARVGMEIMEPALPLPIGTMLEE
ncbi:hypothetical protein ARMGADRAFT_1036399 [Armillaria gallica]|uniref:Uncharacterized protein n=1 Tax=Armillaria gallica TaxID=47427 RepID=A0A2H3DCZ9_ARMGA|nr:hypothetical protein ARMGADRAFT_1036399 [Armillaria gallica]